MQVHSAVEVLCRGAEVQVQVQVEVQIWRCWGRLQAQRQRCRCAVVDVLKRCRVSEVQRVRVSEFRGAGG